MALCHRRLNSSIVCTQNYSLVHGRRVDLLGRSLAGPLYVEPTTVLSDHLSAARNGSAKALRSLAETSSGLRPPHGAYILTCRCEAAVGLDLGSVRTACAGASG